MYQETSSGFWEDSGKEGPGTCLTTQTQAPLTAPVCCDPGLLESLEGSTLPREGTHFKLPTSVHFHSGCSNGHSFPTFQCCGSHVPGTAGRQFWEAMIEKKKKPVLKICVLSMDCYFGAQRGKDAWMSGDVTHFQRLKWRFPFGSFSSSFRKQTSRTMTQKTSQTQEDVVPHMLSPIYGAWVYIDAHRYTHESKGGRTVGGRRDLKGGERITWEKRESITFIYKT